MNYPDRSPLILAEVIQPIIQDKVVCDVGCGQGDLMIEFSKYAKHVIGIDYLDEDEIDNKELDIIHANVLELKELPVADVYYIWIHPRDLDTVIAKIPKGIIILGDYGDKPNITKKYTDCVIKFPHNEGGGYWNIHYISL